MKANELQEQLAIYADLVALYPDHPAYLQRYAELLFESGQRTTAIATLRHLHAVLMQQGKEREAAKLLERWPEIGRLSAQLEAKETIAELLPNEVFGALWRKLHEQPMQEGARLFDEGKPLDAPWLVVEGRLALYRQAQKKPWLVDFAEAGDLVAEGAAFVPDTPAPYAAVASTPAKVLRLPQKRLQKALQHSPALLRALRALVQRREALASLAVHPVFAHASLPARRFLAERATIHRISARKLWRRAAEAIDGIDLLLAGRAFFLVRAGAKVRAIPIRAGEFIGDPPPLSADAKARAQADVLAEAGACLLSLSHHALLAAIEAHAPLKESLLAAYEAQRERLARAIARARS